MQITRATDYAVRVMVHLASIPQGEIIPISELVHASKVRSSFLSKVLQRLVTAGLVSSQRGTGGGFCLRVPREKTTLLDVVEAMEGPLQLNVCVGSAQGCARKASCDVSPYWQKAQNALSKVLASVTIAELALNSQVSVGKAVRMPPQSFGVRDLSTENRKARGRL
jgi:Rrf2 family protein